MLVIGRKNGEKFLIGNLWVTIGCITENSVKAFVNGKAYSLELGKPLLYGSVLIRFCHLAGSTARIGITAPPNINIVRNELLGS